MFLLEINFCDWSPQQLADYFKQRTTKMGGGDYSEMILKHKIDGKVAHRLKDGDLLQMGVTSVGDRLRIMEEIDKLERSLQQKAREKVLWSGKEELYFTWFAQCCSACCGCCPDDPAEYSLTGAHLTITTHQPMRCGPVRCCCGHRYEIDNVDLSHVTDADVVGDPPSCCQQVCCCGKPQEKIHIRTRDDGDKILRLKKQEGAAVARKILNQVEVMQRMERS